MHKWLKYTLVFAAWLSATAVSIAQTVVRLEKEGNVFVAPCKVNGLKLKLFLDTGADVVTLSALEAAFMIKNGYLSIKDILGEQYYQTASGDIEEGTKVILRKIEIGGVVMTNVKATIIHSMDAPLLMGQSALSQLGKITIDYKNNTLTIGGNPGNSTPVKTVKKETKPTPVTDKSGNMVLIQGGSFKMGSNYGKEDEQPQHDVSVSSFYMSRYEVTMKEFKAFIKATGYITTAQKIGNVWAYKDGKMEQRNNVTWEYDVSGIKYVSDQENKPVVYVSWMDAYKYCQWLSSTTGKTYRLPTEAEWEYASRWNEGENAMVYSGSNNIDEVAWSSSNSVNGIHNVGKKKPNAAGLYDMTGNVLEWCADWYDAGYYSHSASNDPKGPASGKTKSVRGGGWHNRAADCRNTDRHYDDPDSRLNYNGFRVLMEE